MADKLVMVPGVGNVAFPGDMSDDEIAGHIKTGFPNLAPQGTAKPNKNTPDPPGMGLKDIAGTASNVINNSAAGASLGSVFGPPGAIIGGGAGALASMFEKPSEHPTTDLAQTGASMGLNAILPGAGAASKLARFVRAGAIGAGTYGAGMAGAQADKAMQFVQDTPSGAITFSAGLSALPQLAKALSAAGVKLTPTAQLADDVGQATGSQIPLSTAQKTGFGGGLENLYGTGSDATKQLASIQSQSIKNAVEKIVGKSLSDTPTAVEDAAGVKFRAQKIISDWTQRYKQNNSVTTMSEEPTGVLDPSGNMNTKTVSTSSTPDNVDWSSLERQYGLTRVERDQLFKAINTDSGTFVDQMMPGRGEGSLKGVVRLRSLMKVLPDEEKGKLGTAVALRILDRSEAFKTTPDGGTMLNGQALASAITRGEGQLKAIFSTEQVDALKKIAVVADQVNPQVATMGRSHSEAINSYLQSKFTFQASGALAGGMMGAAPKAGEQMLQMALGGAAGAGISMTLGTLVSNVLKNPHTADVLLRASKGDATATTAFIRSVVNGVDAEENSKMPSPADRLKGLFSQKK
jgi:hypothetical protein